jgi:hypothetical protein
MPEIDWGKVVWISTLVTLMGFGLLSIGLGGQITHLTCTRRHTIEVNCTLRRDLFGWATISQRDLLDLTDAVLGENCDEDCYYWVSLQTATETMRLTPFASPNRRGVEADQQRIAAFLSDTYRTRFEHIGSPSWVLLILGPLFVGFALLLGVWTRRNG